MYNYVRTILIVNIHLHYVLHKYYENKVYFYYLKTQYASLKTVKTETKTSEYIQSKQTSSN